MQIPFNDIYFNNDASFTAVYKKINDLVKGDKFMAEIVNIRADTVTLRLNDGSKLQAKSLVIPEARIGERVIFAVKENSEGTLQLEFVKGEDANAPNGFINGLLNKFEIPVTKENQEVLRILVKNDIPITQENVDKAMFYKYEDNNISADKILFLLEENIPANENTLTVLDNIMGKNISLKNSIMTVCEEMLGIDDPKLLQKLAEALEIDSETANLLKAIVLSRNAEGTSKMQFGKKGGISDMPVSALKAKDNDSERIMKTVFNKISDKLFVKIKNDEEVKNIPQKLKTLYESASKGEEISKDTAPVLSKAFENIKANIEFSEHIGEYKQYLQIPFSVNGKNEQCELYVFKNPKGSKITADSASMLLGLDMAYLGRVEIYISKNSKSLALQLRSDRAESLSAMKKSFLSLEGSLKKKGYSISSVSYKNIDEPFTVTAKSFDEKEGKGENNENSSAVKKRFSFDMRI